MHVYKYICIHMYKHTYIKQIPLNFKTFFIYNIKFSYHLKDSFIQRLLILQDFVESQHQILLRLLDEMTVIVTE